MTERKREVPEALPVAKAPSPPAPVTEASLRATDEAFCTVAAYVLAKHAELYRRLAQGSTGRERPGDGCGAARDPAPDLAVNRLPDAHGCNRIEADDLDTLRGSSARREVAHLAVPAWTLPDLKPLR